MLFVSHATADDDLVNRLIDRLQAAGIDTWVDHKRLATGDDWPSAIQQAANDCKFGLLVLTPASAASRYVTAEWTRVIDLKKPLYIAMVTTVPTRDFPLRLGIIQYADLV